MDTIQLEWLEPYQERDYDVLESLGWQRLVYATSRAGHNIGMLGSQSRLREFSCVLQSWDDMKPWVL